MATIIRIEHAALGTYGFYDFSDQEIKQRLIYRPGGKHEVQESQVGDMKLYRTTFDHYHFTVPVTVGLYDTITKLWEIRELWDEFLFYPWFRFDQASRFLVVWRNPDAFEEGYRVGLPEANFVITCEFQEPRGAVCYPPS